MKRLSLVLLLTLAGIARAADDDGFVPLFNGRDLTGWVNANCAPETWKAAAGMIQCTGHPTGALRTARQYENFILELEWRHRTSGGNSGVFLWGSPIAAPGVPFLRGIEVQVLDHGFNIPGKNEWYTTHGDVFPIHGASMKPFGRHHGLRSFPAEERSKGTPEWNHYRIVCTNGVIRLYVNGKEVSGGQDCNYRKGYLALESEGAPVDFRNLRLKELPSSNVPAELTAPVDLNWRSLFTGLDFRGWRTNAATAARWRADGERIRLAAGTPNPDSTLWLEADHGAAEFVLDCRTAKPATGTDPVPPMVRFRGGDGKTVLLNLIGAVPGNYQRFSITVQAGEATVKLDEKVTQRLALPAEFGTRFTLGLGDTGGAVEFMNLNARDL